MSLGKFVEAIILAMVRFSMKKIIRRKIWSGILRIQFASINWVMNKSYTMGNIYRRKIQLRDEIRHAKKEIQGAVAATRERKWRQKFWCRGILGLLTVVPCRCHFWLVFLQYPRNASTIWAQTSPGGSLWCLPAASIRDLKRWNTGAEIWDGIDPTGLDMSKMSGNGWAQTCALERGFLKQFWKWLPWLGE